jgi:hypothetical protein
MDDPGKDEKDFLWEHFKFNADQRLKAFNFFVVLALVADGGVVAAIDAGGPVLLLIGAFVCLLSVAFFLIDRRSQHLLRLAIPGLKVYEARFPPHSRLFARAETRPSKVVRYTVAFGILFAAEFVFGLGVVLYGAKIAFG